jgi:NADPH-dependent 2,4-dienoyl-CoA reductase/sulfur reductase-like enzyme/rhodanese-related sulfurtransferase
MSKSVKRIVIIGGVAAGATAAARARRLDEDAEITLIERGPYVSFANCGLPYHISGAIPKRSKLLLQTPEGFFSRYRVGVSLRTEAVSIDRVNKTVTVRDLPSSVDRTIAYDSLILAQGGSPLVPPLPGVDLPQVFRLWTIPDMDAIQKFIADTGAKSAVVVGGGFIGLETAEAFVERGLATTIVELTDHLMPPMDFPFGERIARRFRAAGAAVLTSRAVKAVEPGKVVLDDGSTVSADLVLLSVGVRPNVDLARAAGLEIGVSGALLVNEELRTNDPSIWAAGDMVEVVSKVHGGKARIPLAGPANRQGRIAATNAVGSLPPMRYRGAAGTSVVKIFDETAAMTGLSLAAAGKAGFDAAEATILKADHATYYPGEEDLLLSLVWDRATGKVLGAQAYGKAGVDKRIDAAAVALQAGLTVSDAAELDFAYAPPYASANDPLNMVAFVAENAMSGYSPLAGAADAARSVAAGTGYFLDVRTYGEYAKGHVVGAMQIPLDELRDRLEELPRDKAPFLVSKGGFEGHIGQRLLMQNGFTASANVSGGWATLCLVPGLEIEE